MSMGGREKGARGGTAGRGGRIPLVRRVLAVVVFTVVYFGLALVIQFVLPSGNRDLERSITFALSMGTAAGISIPGWSDPELTRRVREKLPTGETVTLVLPVRRLSGRRPHWFVPDSRVLVLTGTQFLAYARNRLTGSPTRRLWQYSLADPTATVALSTDRKRLTVTTAATPEATGAAAVEDFYIQLGQRKPAAHFVTLSQRGATTQ
ncbi:hypothetical protein DSC45_01625 [Streptomyces sp. YIM 130001]|uniref:hypothetical protein n=1 Tax=Streptomyces sp. YIM 130001 TaxID=2259644 RepID=UPI000ECE33DF|nr:hypothetical protein [Streptomyces sp. YIM 130001]RII21091.1 hypothetical protein DSC45_01625 [Streptomyces sp. YIM 130001]